MAIILQERQEVNLQGRPISMVSLVCIHHPCQHNLQCLDESSVLIWCAYSYPQKLGELVPIARPDDHASPQQILLDFQGTGADANQDKVGMALYMEEP